MRPIVRVFQHIQSTGFPRIERQNGIVLIEALVAVVVVRRESGGRGCNCGCWPILLGIGREKPDRRVRMDEVVELFKLLQMPRFGHLIQSQIRIGDPDRFVGPDIRLNFLRFVHHYTTRRIWHTAESAIPGITTSHGSATVCRCVDDLSGVGNLLIRSAEKRRQVRRLVNGFVHLLRRCCLMFRELFGRAQTDGLEW